MLSQYGVMTEDDKSHGIMRLRAQQKLEFFHGHKLAGEAGKNKVCFLQGGKPLVEWVGCAG